MNFPNKFYMRKITRSVGLGFTQPIALENSRGPAQVMAKDEKNNCGNYSCSQSQRVELSFVLKDDPKTLEKIIQFKEGGL